MSTRGELHPDDRVGLAPHVRVQWEDAQESWVLLYPKGNVRLNETAGEILRRCTQDRTIRDTVDELQEAFDMDQSIAEDVLEFLEVARGKGWIRVGP